ncbi:PadR family transcriptional regulator [Actinokineospora enzanensis]|uniref:PadR family transcriptional regulator n=1 Tax=Actinokineospora enzanensis TaxID=155975 RepID=UPI00037E21A3|nr:PadR family transcriptional regulator [Actinokineospora enzanensis]
MARRPSAQTLAVLEVLARDPDTPRYGYQLCKELDLKAGTLYPILIRLCERGFLAASWESDPPAGRPPRHLYRVLGAGVQLIEEARERSPQARSGRQSLRGAW